jgi:hypothetical protein
MKGLNFGVLALSIGAAAASLGFPSSLKRAPDFDRCTSRARWRLAGLRALCPARLSTFPFCINVSPLMLVPNATFRWVLTIGRTCVEPTFLDLPFAPTTGSRAQLSVARLPQFYWI